MDIETLMDKENLTPAEIICREVYGVMGAFTSSLEQTITFGGPAQAGNIVMFTRGALAMAAKILQNLPNVTDEEGATATKLLEETASAIDSMLEAVGLVMVYEEDEDTVAH